MSAVLRCLMMFLALSLLSCREESTSREEARIRKEVDRRVETIRSEMKVSENRWRTVRTVTFCLLAGGSLIWLFSGSAPAERDHSRLPDRTDYPPQSRRRVIDRNHDEDDESESNPYRR